ITPDPRFLLPDGEETLIAAKYLAKNGFKVMPYINADPILAKKLEDIGCVSVMPLGAPIGTNGGLQTLSMIKIIIKQSFVPVIIDAGIGKPSDAAFAMELGASAVMINTAVATAKDPVGMSTAFKLAIDAGRKGYLSGLPSEKDEAEASSPLDWIKDL
ncbi:MAG TPA: HisA/HisF-related TIM barrel protein, partial [Spirochaetota bacterium]|nr:HisA/HisF-related TIM barrel protein [Spirochaetota bacterium]